MALKLEVWSGSNWIDKTNSCVSLRRQIRSGVLEELDGELVKDAVSVGQEIRLKEDDRTIFMGVVYEVDRRHRSRDVERCGFKAYDYLIKYDRRVVYRLYQVGTKAGEIIWDLGKLANDEVPVILGGIEDGDALLSPWKIQNEKALDVMKSVARGINYWLRMKPYPHLSMNCQSYVRIPESPSINLSTFTYLWWFRHRGGGSGGSFSRIFGRGGFQFEVAIDAETSELKFYDGSWKSFNYSLPFNVWHCLAIAYDGSRVKLYVDGELVKAVSGGRALSGDQYIGSQYLGGERVKGDYSAVLLYDGVLDDSQIRKICRNIIHPPTDNLVLWLPMNEGEGSIAHDRSGNGNDGEIHNPIWDYSMLLEFKPKVIA